MDTEIECTSIKSLRLLYNCDVTPKVWTVYSSWCIRMSIFAELQGKDTLFSCLEQRVGGRTAIWPSRPDRRSRSSRSAYIPAAVLTSRMSVVVHTPFYIVWDFFLLDVIWFSSHYSILYSRAILVQSDWHHGNLEDITVQTLAVRRSSPSWSYLGSSLFSTYFASAHYS